MRSTKNKSKSAHDPLLKKIGLKIARHLHEQDRSAEWLAFEADIARSTLREIIAGRSNPRVLTLRGVAVALGYSSLDDFLRKL